MPIPFRPEMHKNTANTSVFESKANKSVNYNIFCGLIVKNAGIYSAF